MARGRVEKFYEKKGFGFIKQDGSGEDVFVHFSNIIGDGYKILAPGDIVEFDLVEGDKGLKALNVRKVGHEN